MFNATEFHLLRTRSPDKLSTLLTMLSVPSPDWTTGDEFQLSSDLDDAITTKLSHLMKSESVIGGYIGLLNLGKVTFDYSETDNELLRKIISERERIRMGALCSPVIASEQNVITNVKEKYDFSSVQCKIWKKECGGTVGDYGVNIGLEIHDPKLAGIIKNVICEYWQEHKEIDIASIDISLECAPRKTRLTRREIQQSNRSEPEKSSPSFSPDEIGTVLETLRFLNNIIVDIGN